MPEPDPLRPNRPRKAERERPEPIPGPEEAEPARAALERALLAAERAPLVYVLGAPDTGKTTLSGRLVEALAQRWLAELRRSYGGGERGDGHGSAPDVQGSG